MTRKKVFLPKWQRWYVVPLMMIIWAFITYMEFFNAANDEKMGTIGYVLMSLLFLGIAGIMYLMTSGRLPAYEIEEDENKGRYSGVP